MDTNTLQPNMATGVPKQYSPDEFAQTIKAKYPQYQNVDNNTLTQKMLAKYPMYASKVNMNTQPPQKDFLQNASDAVSNIFPGKQLGTALGNSAVAIGNTIQGGVQNLMGNKEGANQSFQMAQQASNENNQNYGKIAGDTANIVGTIGAPLVGGGTAGGLKGAATRIGANTALGAGLGVANSVSQGQSAGETAGNAALGGAVSGGLSGVGEIGGYLSKNMPNWFTKLALPKLGSNLKGTPQETIDYALKNTKGATLNTMYGNSKNAIGSYEKQIGAVLSHPQYANETGGVAKGIQTVQDAHSNAGLDSKKIVNIIKQVAPANKTLVDKVANGTANLAEQNTLRKELDQATKAAYGDKPNLSFAKQVGKSMADFLRTNVQGTAKETVPIFSEYSKEHTLNKALGTALSKKRVAGPLVAGGAGFAHSGIGGALEGIAIEEGLRSPTAKLLAAKAIKGGSKVINPIANAAFQGGKAPLVKAVTDNQR